MPTTNLTNLQTHRSRFVGIPGLTPAPRCVAWMKTMKSIGHMLRRDDGLLDLSKSQLAFVQPSTKGITMTASFRQKPVLVQFTEAQVLLG
ncbi:MAG TPA: hypothetical protein VNT26_23370, partial [Candidatus Sulfotelmatobacter sp.]|nr:hypothetical protein [Candidatus Sulfotelmatobacter sp.]